MSSRPATANRSRLRIVHLLVVMGLTATLVTLRVGASDADELPDDPAAEILESLSLGDEADQVVGTDVLAALSTRIAPEIGDSQLDTVGDVPTAEVLVALDPEALDYDINTEQGQAALANEVREIIGDVPPDAISEITQWDGIRGFAAEVSLEAVAALAEDSGVEVVNLEDGAGIEFSDNANRIINLDDLNIEGFNGQGIEVAVVDSGVDTSHPDLAPAKASEACFAEGGAACPQGLTKATDETGHGTMVAGIIASRGERAPTGGAPGVGLHAVKVLDGTGRASSSRYILDGLNHIIENLKDVKVVNISIGSYTQFPGDCDTEAAYTRLYADAINTLTERGTAVVVAAGNAGNKDLMSAPGCVANAISVGATYSAGVSGMQASCSDADTPVDKVTCYSSASATTDVFAPGTYVRSTYPGGTVSAGSGTSFAAPVVAACVAALEQVYKGATVAEIESWLESSPVLVNAGTRQFPRIDCVKAAAVARSGSGIRNTPEPTPTPEPTATPRPKPTSTPAPEPEAERDPSLDYIGIDLDKLDKLVAATVQTCEGDSGMVSVSVSNPLDEPVNLSVAIGKNDAVLMRVEPNDEATATSGELNDGLYRVRVRSGEELIENSLARVACRPETQIETRCENGAGVVAATITNKFELSSRYSVSVGGLAPVAADIMRYQQDMLEVGDLPNGTHQLSVQRDGTEIHTESIDIACASPERSEDLVPPSRDNAPEQPPPSEDESPAPTATPPQATEWRPGPEQGAAEASIATACLAGSGKFSIGLANYGEADATYTVFVPGYEERAFRLSPGTVMQTTLLHARDADYPIVIFRDDTTILSESATIDCR